MNKVKKNILKRCFLIGIGMGNSDTLTQRALSLLESASVIVGADRMIDSLPKEISAKKIKTFVPQKIAAAFESDFKSAEKNNNLNKFFPCAVYSGDTGFYSGASSVVSLLESSGWSVSIVPGISTVQYLSAKIGRSWQNWRLVSAHGVECNIGAELAGSAQTFFLTDGNITPQKIAEYLVSHGAEDSLVTVAYNLSYKNEKIISGTAKKISSSNVCKKILQQNYLEHSLAAVLVERKIPSYSKNTAAKNDSFFIRNTDSSSIKKTLPVPMTKQCVRAEILSMLSVSDGEVVWDVGAGTGAVSIDVALSAKCSVYAVEEKKNACAIEKLNRKKAGAVNMDIICARAPDALANLPVPDAVFVGGSNGCLEKIINLVFKKNKNARIVVSSVTAETFSEAFLCAKKSGAECSVVQISFAQSMLIGREINSEQNYHLMKAQNPVCLFKIKLH